MVKEAVCVGQARVAGVADGGRMSAKGRGV